MFTTLAYSASQDEAAADTNLAAVSDQHVKVSGNNIYVPEMNQVLGSMVCLGSTAVRAFLTSPSLRRVSPHYVKPIIPLIVQTAKPVLSMDPNRLTSLDVDEPLQVVVNADPAAAEQHAVIVWLTDKPITPVSGQIFTIRTTMTLALAVNTWTFSTLTFTDELAVGTYAIVGARAEKASLIAARFVTPGVANRPGFPGVASVGIDDADLFRNGKLGEWCRFNTQAPPGIECLGSVAVGSATTDVYIDVLRIS